LRNSQNVAFTKASSVAKLAAILSSEDTLKFSGGKTGSKNSRACTNKNLKKLCVNFKKDEMR
jgi:hypothetical protein